MRHSMIAAAALLAIAVTGSTASADVLSPTQAISRAIAPKFQAIQACGIHDAGAVARFSVGFDGKIEKLKVEGIGDTSIRDCVTRNLSEIQMPKRLAFIVRDVALPLPVATASR